MEQKDERAAAKLRRLFAEAQKLGPDALKLRTRAQSFAASDLGAAHSGRQVRAKRSGMPMRMPLAARDRDGNPPRPSLGTPRLGTQYDSPTRRDRCVELAIMNRLLSVVRSMIDKIIELSRAVVNEALLWRKYTGGRGRSGRRSGRHAMWRGNFGDRPPLSVASGVSAGSRIVECHGHSHGVGNAMPGTRRTTHSICGVSIDNDDHGGRHARRRIAVNPSRRT